MIQIPRSLLARPTLLIIAGIAITMATTSVTAFSLYEMRLDAMAHARDAATNLASSLQTETERTFDIYELAMRDVVTVAETPSAMRLPAETRWRLAFNAASNMGGEGAIFSADITGNNVLDSHSISPSSFNVGDRDYFKIHQLDSGSGLFLSKPFLERASGLGQPAIALSLPLVNAEGRFAGIVAGMIQLSYFHQLFEGSILGENGSITLLRTDGTIVMRQPYHGEDIGKTLAGGHAFLPLVQSDHGTYIDSAVIDHIERLYSFRRVSKLPLIVVVGLATHDIYAEWRRRAVTICTVTATLDLLTVMLSVMFYAQLRRRLAMEHQLQTLALFDVLTGLPNRTQLNREAHRVLRNASKSSSPFAILFIDLDRFKRVNDTQGHCAGDEVLRKVARRLQDYVQNEGVIGRLGGDEFLAILECSDSIRAAEVASRILLDMSRPITVSERFGTHITLSASIGISLYPYDGQDPDTLLRNADIAMYKAKSSGCNQLHFYAPLYERQAKEKLELEIALQRAIREGILNVVFQPKVDAMGALRGAEALIRWNDPVLGAVPPDRFIGIAEECGLIVELDTWVLGEACRQLSEWRVAGVDVPNISVNVCAADFMHRSYTENIARLLQEHGLEPSDLTLEMTERLMFDDSSDAIRASLAKIQALGIALSVDDFGTGYSSLSYLHRFPAKELKIDKSFVSGIGSDAMAESLAQSVINIGNALRLNVVAEGVETAAQRDFLHDHGCYIYQGYFYSRPLPPRDFSVWVQTRQLETVDIR